MRTRAASAVGARSHNENDVTMTIAGLQRYGDWRHVATGCTALELIRYSYSISITIITSKEKKNEQAKLCSVERKCTNRNRNWNLLIPEVRFVGLFPVSFATEYKVGVA